MNEPLVYRWTERVEQQNGRRASRQKTVRVIDMGPAAQLAGTWTEVVCGRIPAVQLQSESKCC